MSDRSRWPAGRQPAHLRYRPAASLGSQVERRLRGMIGVARVDGQLVSGLRTWDVTLLLQQVPKVERREGSRVFVAGIDGHLVGSPRALVFTLINQQATQVDCRPGGVV